MCWIILSLNIAVIKKHPYIREFPFHMFFSKRSTLEQTFYWKARIWSQALTVYKRLG